MKLIYLDAGSGAERPVSERIIEKVSNEIKCPLIVGGGIMDETKLSKAYVSGADVVVVGNAIENNASLIHKLSEEKFKY